MKDPYFLTLRVFNDEILPELYTSESDQMDSRTLRCIYKHRMILLRLKDDVVIMTMIWQSCNWNP